MSTERTATAVLPYGFATVESLDDAGKRAEVEEATGCKLDWTSGRGRNCKPTVTGTAEQLRRARKIFSFYCDTQGMEVPSWYPRTAKAACKAIDEAIASLVITRAL